MDDYASSIIIMEDQAKTNYFIDEYSCFNQIVFY